MDSSIFAQRSRIPSNAMLTIMYIGIDKIIDREIQPRERIDNYLLAHINRPDRRILAVEEYDPVIIELLNRLTRRSDDLAYNKVLMMRQVKRRQRDQTVTARLRYAREILLADVRAVIRQVDESKQKSLKPAVATGRAKEQPGRHSRESAPSPTEGVEEPKQKIKSEERTPSPMEGIEELGPKRKGWMDSPILKVEELEGEELRDCKTAHMLSQLKCGDEQSATSSGQVQEPQHKRKRRCDSPLEGVIKPEVKRVRSGLPQLHGDKAANASTTPTCNEGLSKCPLELKKEDEEGDNNNKGEAKEQTAQAVASLQLEGVSRNNSIIATLYDGLKAGDNGSSMVNAATKLLNNNLDRLEAISRVPGLTDDQGNKISEFRAHLIASANLDEAKHSLERTEFAHFVAHHFLEMDDDITHIKHKRTVLVDNILKLCTYIEGLPGITLDEELKQRVFAALGSLPSA